jgi:HMG (high mobility group) box
MAPPKRPRTAYISYILDNYQQAKASVVRGTNSRKIIQALGYRWRDLPEADRRRYQAVADEENSRRMRERKAREMQQLPTPVDAEVSAAGDERAPAPV